MPSTKASPGFFKSFPAVPRKRVCSCIVSLPLYLCLRLPGWRLPVTGNCFRRESTLYRTFDIYHEASSGVQWWTSQGCIGNLAERRIPRTVCVCKRLSKHHIAHFKGDLSRILSPVVTVKLIVRGTVFSLLLLAFSSIPPCCFGRASWQPASTPRGDLLWLLCLRFQII